MAFKDLQREVLEEFAGAQGVEEREVDAGLPALRHGSRKRAAKKQETRFQAAFLAKLTRRRVAPPEPVLSCCVCRAPCISKDQLLGHFRAHHPDVDQAYRLRVATASLDQDRALLRRLERQLAAARDLVLALEDRIAKLARRLR